LDCSRKAAKHVPSECEEEAKDKCNYKYANRNPKLETNPNDQKAENPKPAHLGFPFLSLGFECFGLF